MANILFITPMWYEPITSCDPKVCNYFVDEWVKQGHTVVVAHYRSKFPKLYHKIGRMLPALRRRLCGDNSSMYLDNEEIRYDYRGLVVFSIPILKYIPHGVFAKKTIDEHGNRLIRELNHMKFVPDAIIGHFCNPSVAIIERLRGVFINSKTSIILHERVDTVRRILGKNTNRLLNNLDVIGYRSLSIRRSLEENFKLTNKRFICYSGITSSFLERERPMRKWSDGPIKDFLFVGRMVFYKHPLAIVKALHTIYADEEFSMRYIGKEDVAYSETCEYVVSHGLDKSVSFLGQMDRDDIINWYDKSDCFVMISDNEVFGLVYLEAMSRGCITIAGNNGGMEGIIKSGENGFLCKPGDNVELASIIDKINRMSATDKEKISINAQKTAREFSDSRVAEVYLQNIL